MSDIARTDTEIRAAVRHALAQIAPEIDPATLRPDEPLHDHVDLDSVDFLDFVLELARSVGVEVPEEDYPQFAT
ncbi:MAG TPA: phosphopantetheine-binding protein, partial [Gemmatimonadaceae bacterium]|nr:phosphopantetheine-binding protein [Gemmatimonadaceae bacterium]